MPRLIVEIVGEIESSAGGNAFAIVMFGILVLSTTVAV